MYNIARVARAIFFNIKMLMSNHTKVDQVPNEIFSLHREAGKSASEQSLE